MCSSFIPQDLQNGEGLRHVTRHRPEEICEPLPIGKRGTSRLITDERNFENPQQTRHLFPKFNR